MLLQVLQCLQGTLKISTLVYAAIAVILPISLGLAFVYYNGDISSTRRKLRHLERIGLSASNMTDQFDSKYDAPESTETNGPIRIKSIYIHPIKSCGFVEVNRALLTKAGFMYDRSFALVTEVADPDTGSITWRFISQRTKPGMSQIKTEIWLPRKCSNQNDPLVQAGGCLAVNFQDPDPPSWARRLETLMHTGNPAAKPEVSFIVPLHPTPTLVNEFGIKTRTFGIHSRDATGLDFGKIPSVAAALPKLKKFLSIPEKRALTLTRCTPDSLTRTQEDLAPLEYIGSPSVHGYTDQQPININSLSSVHAVSALLPQENQPLDARRFRANIWVTGAPAFAEETWKRYRIVPKGSSRELRANVSPNLSVVSRTSRCTMPNVNISTGTFDSDNAPVNKKKGKPQPSATLVKHRMVETSNPKALGYIGMHCVPEDQSLETAREQKVGLYVEVGDEIEVLETGDHMGGSTGNDH